MCRRLRRPLAVIAALVFMAFIAIQFVPVDRSNPPGAMEVSAPPEVMALLRRSCYDCHSNETRWPWYGYVAPLSWLIEKDIRDGRDQLNFSTWDQYSARKRARSIDEIYEVAAAGEMPLPIYLITHGDARLSPQDLVLLRAWAASDRSQTGDEPGAESRSDGERE